MLGNMTLLSPSDNKSSASFNASFAAKKPIFGNSSIPSNTEIAKEREWTPEVIRKRQADLANRACEVWKAQT